MIGIGILLVKESIRCIKPVICKHTIMNFNLKIIKKIKNYKSKVPKRIKKIIPKSQINPKQQHNPKRLIRKNIQVYIEMHKHPKSLIINED